MAILTPAVETLIMGFPVQPGQPFTPVYIVMNAGSLQVFAETTLQNMDAYTHMVNLGTALSACINTFQETA